MSFASMAKKKELYYTEMLLSCFKVLRLTQLRSLFPNLKDEEFGRLLYRLPREGSAFIDRNGGVIKCNKEQVMNEENELRMMCAWVLINMRSYVTDITPGVHLGILTISAGRKTYDLIPVTKQIVQDINHTDWDDLKTDARIFVMKDISIAEELEVRAEKDYAYVVDANGVKEIFELKEENDADGI